MLIPRVHSGHNVSLTPGIYTVTIESVSGTEQVSSNLEHVIVMNSKVVCCIRQSFNALIIHMQDHLLHMSQQTWRESVLHIEL